MADRRWRIRRARDADRPAMPGPLGERRRPRQPATPEDAARRLLLGLVLAQALVLLALTVGWWGLALSLHLAACIALPILAWLMPQTDDLAESWSGAVLRLVLAVQPVLGPLAAAGGVAALLGGLPGRLRDQVPPLPDDPLDARLDAIATARAVPHGLLLESLGDVLRWGHAGRRSAAAPGAA